MRYLLIATLATSLFLLACSQSEPSCEVSEEEVTTGGEVEPLNPNGDTELALLMRAMYDDGMAMKAALESGVDPVSNIDLSNLYTSDCADPEKVASNKYKAMAEAYRASLNAMHAANSADKLEAYRNVVNTCKTCHQSMCPGPLMKIKHLEL